MTLINSQNVEQDKEHILKTFWRIPEYDFFIDKDGKRPDPEWANAIKYMSTPENVSSLQSFIGLTNCYQALIPNMHNSRGPLNELLKKEMVLEWTPKYEYAFVKIKEVLTSDLFLTHYNPELDIRVASDTSSHGIGACILPKQVAHASWTLLLAEKNYSQIEELLRIIFAVTKFHHYIHGRHFILQTFHKPLLTIFSSKKTVFVLLFFFLLLLFFKSN